MILLVAMMGLAHAECHLQSLLTTVQLQSSEEVPWTRTDEWTLEIGTGDVPCRVFEVESLPDVAVVQVRAVIRQPDDTRVVLASDRLQTVPIGTVQTRTVLHLPELRNRDRLTVRVDREPRAAEIPVRWRPGWRGGVPSAELRVDGVADPAAIVVFEDGQSVPLPSASRTGELWRWSLSDVPDGRPESQGSTWMGAEWWVSPGGSLQDLAVTQARQVPTAPVPDLVASDASWMNRGVSPLRVVNAGPQGLEATEVWARGWGRSWDVGRAILLSLGGPQAGFKMGIVRVPGSAQWTESVVLDPAGQVIFASAPQRMLGADGIEVGSGAALDLPAPQMEVVSHLTGMIRREGGWQVTHAAPTGSRVEHLGEGPVVVSSLMPVMDTRPTTARRGRLWTGMPRRVVWTLQLPGVTLQQLPEAASGKGPSTQWSAGCKANDNGSICEVSVEQEGGWLDAASISGLGLVHEGIASWASQTIEATP